MKIIETSLEIFPSGSPVQVINKTVLQLGDREAPGRSLRSHFEKRTPFRSQEEHTPLSASPAKAFVNAFRVYYGRPALAHYEYQ